MPLYDGDEASICKKEEIRPQIPHILVTLQIGRNSTHLLVILVSETWKLNLIYYWVTTNRLTCIPFNCTAPLLNITNFGCWKLSKNLYNTTCMCKQHRWVKLWHIYKTGRYFNTADPPHSWVCTLQFCLFMEKLRWQHLCTVVWSPHSFILTLVIELCDKYKNLAFKVLLAHNNAPGHLKVSLLSIQRNTPSSSQRIPHSCCSYSGRESLQHSRAQTLATQQRTEMTL